ncbi:unnamed protein product [Lactuca virosa]|uniref:GTD-binding domain-containing protein n=1 Tax=Lactuca virosa TaxID=75947 RepID=A0AAU9N3Q7_9ASTR|nr:unnamed protein product [Lactuca virosa]
MTENNTDSIMGIEETGKSLKETLRAQQQLLQKLYNELDVEREASSSAASEALAMILRLQGEKASVKMESEHYKRLAEEKMCHAEESIEIFEEQIHQKEMEIASLDCQLQAYRYKLASLGFEDIGANETSHESLLRRNSAPPKLLRLAYLKKNRSISPDSDINSRTLDENVGEDESLDLEKQSYWDQIRKLDKIVEEMADDEYVNLRIKSSKSSSGFPQINELDENQSVKKLENDEMPSDTCSLSVHDVFEVPEINEVEDNGKLILESENKLEKVLIFPEEAIKSYEKMLLLKQKEKEVFLPRENIVVDCHMAIDFPVEGSSQQVKRRMERREDDIEDEQIGITGKEEVLRLLNEINQKLDSIQFEIRNGNKKNEKLSQSYDLQMLQLSEAMLHFWL